MFYVCNVCITFVRVHLNLQAPEVIKTTEIQLLENMNASGTLKDALSRFSYAVRKSKSIPDLPIRSNTKSKIPPTQATKSIGAKDNSTSFIKHPPDSINFDNCLTSSQPE